MSRTQGRVGATFVTSFGHTGTTFLALLFLAAFFSKPWKIISPFFYNCHGISTEPMGVSAAETL